MAEAIPNPAEREAAIAIEKVYECIEAGRSFRFEAGAGAGKTYSLIRTLKHLIATRGTALLRGCQKIACITYTNVAKEEIESRTDRHPATYCDTIHGFCWSLIKDLQPYLSKELPKIDEWHERLEESGGMGGRLVQYSLGYRAIDSNSLSLHHDDVLGLFVALMEYPKFRALLVTRHPFLFIDEYQDTNTEFAGSLKKHWLDAEGGPLIGLFGDHWQKIYRGVCGKVEHPNLTEIGKKSNFRSVTAVVGVLNRMRPELPQEVTDPEADGFVAVYHTNEWEGERRNESHWKGDLPADAAHNYLDRVRQELTEAGWKFSPDKTRILMLTHSVLAKEQGYSNLAAVFPYNDLFIEKTDPHIAFLVDTLEPVCRAFHDRQFGKMFAVLGGKVPAIHSHSDKIKWATDLEGLLKVRESGSVGDVMDYVLGTKRPRVPEAVESKERERARLEKEPDQPMPIPILTLCELRKVPYKEVIALSRYLEGNTPFSTKHGVKGAEFENVLVVVGRGWNIYNFGKMLEKARASHGIPQGKWDAFERSRNLFYVSCSRPKKRLAVLFTQELSDEALTTLGVWFGKEEIHALGPE